MSDNATQDIVNFVSKQPLWQKDALRRLVQTGALSEDDYNDLFLILKKDHGIPLPKDTDIEAKPVEIDQLQSTTEESDVLLLTNIGKLQNVNLIDQTEILDFCPGLTVVYGDNGTGKSGYTRMLKQACASRGQQDILANVYDKDYKASGPATFEFAYMRLPSNDEEVPSTPVSWSVGEAHNDQMRRIRIYDSNVAQKLLQDNNDAEIPLPYNLDLLDTLCDACEVLNKKVSDAKTALEEKREPFLSDLETKPNVRSAFIKLLENENKEEVEALLTFDEEDEKRLNELEPIVIDPSARLAQLKEDLGIYTEVKEKFDDIIRLLAEKAVNQHVQNYNELKTAKAAQKKAREEFDLEQDKEKLEGITTDAWEVLWNAAKKFSTKEAYKDQEFPVTKVGDDEALCPLCLQELSPDAQARFERFHQYIEDDLAQTIGDLETALEEYIKHIKPLDFFKTETSKKSIEQIKQYNKEFSEGVDVFLKTASETHAALLSLDLVDEWTYKGEELPKGFDKKLEECEKAISKQIETIQSSDNDEQQQKLLDEYNALLIRQTLNGNAESVLQFWKDAMVIKNFAEAEEKSLNKRPISTQKTQLVKKYADQTFIDEVSTECKALGVRQTVTLKFSSPNAVTKHKTQIAESNHDKIHEVLSEGESRAVSLACFLAEARIISNGDTLIFDDPVCSLDHRFRERVADRIAKLASDRQVIVFTHDLVFWSELRAKASDVFDVDDKDMYHEIFLERGMDVTGQKGQEAPWKMKKVKQRIPDLKQELAAAKKLDEEYKTQEYEGAIRNLGKNLRIAWEKLVEDELFKGVVIRYRDSVQTQSLHEVDINDEIYEDIRIGMTKASAWGPHDEAIAKQISPPNSDEVEAEINRLEGCLQKIKDIQAQAKANRKSPTKPHDKMQQKQATS